MVLFLYRNRINRNIVECKDILLAAWIIGHTVLIETLWNVKFSSVSLATHLFMY